MKSVLVNGLTLLRIPLSLFFCIGVLHNPKPYFVCVILFLLIGASDHLDGKLARKYKVQTYIGAKLDVIADFFFILLSCLSLIYGGLFPKWMGLVIILKFLEFLVTSFLYKKGFKSTTVFLFDPIGRIVAVLFYLLPILTLLLLRYSPETLYEPILNLICISITITAVVSSTFRTASLIKMNTICIHQR